MSEDVTRRSFVAGTLTAGAVTAAATAPAVAEAANSGGDSGSDLGKSTTASSPLGLRQFGATGENWYASDVTMAVGSNVVSSPTLAAVVSQGMVAIIAQAGAYGASAPLHAGLSGFVGSVNQSTNTFTVVDGNGNAVDASYSASNTIALAGVDDTNAISNWLDQCNADNVTGCPEPGRYLCGLISKSYSPSVIGDGNAIFVPIAFGNWLWTFAAQQPLDSTTAPLTADLTRRMTVPSVAVQSDWREGDLMYLRDKSNFWGGAPGNFNGTLTAIEQIPNSTSLHLETGPYTSFTVANGASLTKVANYLDTPVIKGIRFENRVNSRYTMGYVWLQWCREPDVDIDAFGHGHAALIAFHVYGGRLRTRSEHGYDNNMGYGGAYGYGLAVYGASAQVDCWVSARQCRHAFAAIGGNDSAGLPGIVSDIRVTGTASGCTLQAWDAHELSSDIAFIGTTTFSGKGISHSLRGVRGSVIGGIVDGCVGGVAMACGVTIPSGTSASSCQEPLVEGLVFRKNISQKSYTNATYAIQFGGGQVTNGGALLPINRVTIKDCHFDDLQNSAICASAGGATNVIITGNSARDLGLAGVAGDQSFFLQQSNAPLTNAFIDQNQAFDDQAKPTLQAIVTVTGTLSNVVVGERNFTNVTSASQIAGSGASNVVRSGTLGGTASMADGATIKHGLGIAPARYAVTTTVAGHQAAITAVSATTLTVALRDTSGNPITKAEPIAWSASA